MCSVDQVRFYLTFGALRTSVSLSMGIHCSSRQTWMYGLLIADIDSHREPSTPAPNDPAHPLRVARHFALLLGILSRPCSSPSGARGCRGVAVGAEEREGGGRVVAHFQLGWAHAAVLYGRVASDGASRSYGRCLRSVTDMGYGIRYTSNLIQLYAYMGSITRFPHDQFLLHLAPSIPHTASMTQKRDQYRNS